MKITTKTISAIAAVGLAGFALAACSSSSSVDQNTPAVATIPTLSGQSTAVALDPSFLSALTSLKVTPGTLGTATLAAGSISFPITGGNVTYYTPGSRSPYVTGDIKHDGSGLSLTAGSTVVDLTNFDIDPGTSKLFGDVAVNGKSAVSHAYLFRLDGSTLKPLQTGANSTAILEGTRVDISEAAATLLNQTFKTNGIPSGLFVGVAKITVNTK